MSRQEVVRFLGRPDRERTLAPKEDTPAGVFMSYYEYDVGYTRIWLDGGGIVRFVAGYSCTLGRRHLYETDSFDGLLFDAALNVTRSDNTIEVFTPTKLLIEKTARGKLRFYIGQPHTPTPDPTLVPDVSAEP